MKFVTIRLLSLVLFSLCAACYADGQTQQAQAGPSQAESKAFVTEYVAAFDAKDAARLQALYDSKSRACITGEGKDYYEGATEVMWRTPIPAKYTFTVSAVNENNLKAIETFGRFATKPERELHIDYQQGDDSGSVIVYLLRENGHWSADQPCLTEEALKKFRDEAPARKEREAHYKALAGAIQEPLHSQLIALLRKHKTAEAIDRYKAASGQDEQASMLVMDQLARDVQK